MKMTDLYPSNYLKSSDLGTRKVRVVVLDVRQESVGDELKPCMYFANKDKGIVLNKTNALMMEFHFGAETDDWHGKEILLKAEPTTFQGKAMMGIRIEVPVTEVAPAPDPAAVDDADIPF